MFTPDETARNLIQKYGHGEAFTWANHYEAYNFDLGNTLKAEYWTKVKAEIKNFPNLRR